MKSKLATILGLVVALASAATLQPAYAACPDARTIYTWAPDYTYYSFVFTPGTDDPAPGEVASYLVTGTLADGFQSGLGSAGVACANHNPCE